MQTGKILRYIPCPGSHLHTSPTGEKDCAQYEDGGIYCLHASCREAVAEWNKHARRGRPRDIADFYAGTKGNGLAELRQAREAPQVPCWTLADALHADPHPLAPDDLAGSMLGDIMATFWGVNEWHLITDRKKAATPRHRNANGGMILCQGRQTFYREGGRLAAGGDISEYRQRTDEDGVLWHNCTLADPEGAEVEEGGETRRKWRVDKNLLAIRFLVLESDTLTSAEALKVFGFLRSLGLKLATLTSSAGKSIHGTIQLTDPDKATFQRHEKELKRRLSALGFDAGALTFNRYSRMPYGRRKGREQELLWHDPNAPRIALEDVLTALEKPTPPADCE